MRKLWMAALLGLIGAGAASAAPLAPDAFKMRTFSDVVAVCAAADEDSAQFCRGWLVGNGSLYATLVKAGVIRPWACAPEPVPSLDEIRRAIVAYGESNPQTGSEGAVDGFWRAAASIWPCKQ